MQMNRWAPTTNLQIKGWKTKAEKVNGTHFSYHIATLKLKNNSIDKFYKEVLQLKNQMLDLTEENKILKQDKEERTHHSEFEIRTLKDANDRY